MRMATAGDTCPKIKKVEFSLSGKRHLSAGFDECQGASFVAMGGQFM